MGILDGLIARAGNRIDLDEMAGRVGLSTDELERGGEAMLGRLAGGQQDASSAAAETGVSAASLQALLPELQKRLGAGGGNEGFQGLLDQAKGFADRDGDGNPLNDLGGIAKGLFGRN